MLKVQPSSPAHIRQSTFINSELNLFSEKNTFSIVGNFFNLSFHVTTHMAQMFIDNVSHTCEDPPIFQKLKELKATKILETKILPLPYTPFHTTN